MGTIAARKARDIIKNTQRVLATELLAACQAIDFREGFTLGKGTKECYKAVREVTDFIDKDVVMYKELDKVLEIIVDNTILDKVEKVVKINY